MKQADSLDSVFSDYAIDPAFTELREHAKRLVRDRTNEAEIKTVFVGEAPGRNEDRVGVPFIGASGALLRGLLTGVGLRREEIYVTNVVKYRPVIEGRNRPPSPQETMDSLPYLRRELRIVRAPFLVTLGAHALRAIVPGAPPVSVSHGQILRTTKGKPVVVLYHPAVALYSPSYLKVLSDDFEAVREAMKEDF